MTWLALDIGGANLKAADGLGFALSRPFPLWQRPHDLAAILAQVLADSPSAERLAVTMTGELADCFVTKTEGVSAILEAVVAAAGRRSVLVYLTDGSWASPGEATARPILAAASNWHALARFAGRYMPEPAGLVIDIGSTTCDIIPLVHGAPAACGHTDPERMLHGELVYAGVERTPVCALVDRVPWQGRTCPVARELFATTWDVYLLLEDLPEEPSSTHTADGRPATVDCAHERMARLICADRDMVDRPAVVAMARAVAAAELDQIVAAARQVVARLPETPRTIVISGRGEFLARRVCHRLGLSANVVSLRERLGEAVSEAAPAHALALLAREIDRN